jgi:hypothetical protein
MKEKSEANCVKYEELKNNLSKSEIKGRSKSKSKQSNNSTNKRRMSSNTSKFKFCKNKSCNKIKPFKS